LVCLKGVAVLQSEDRTFFHNYEQLRKQAALQMKWTEKNHPISKVKANL